MVYLSTLLLSIFVTIALIPILGRLALRFNVGLDKPDSRKVHLRPVPRVGGIAITLGVYGSGLFWGLQDEFLNAYLIGSAFIVLFGILDDVEDVAEIDDIRLLPRNLRSVGGIPAWEFPFFC